MVAAHLDQPDRLRLSSYALRADQSKSVGRSPASRIRFRGSEGFTLNDSGEMPVHEKSACSHLDCGRTRTPSEASDERSDVVEQILDVEA